MEKIKEVKYYDENTGESSYSFDKTEIGEKVNEIVEWINNHKDQLLNETTMKKEINNDIIFCDNCEAPINGKPFTEDDNEVFVGKKFCHSDCAESWWDRNKD